MKKINIGISIGVTGDTSIWNNGLNQNIAFLVQLLRRVPGVGEVFLINAGEADVLPTTLEFEGLDVRLLRPADATYLVDLVIEAGVSLSLEWLGHVRALGARIVTFFAGHAYPAQAEIPIFERPSGQAFIGTPWHEIWTLPQYAKSSVPMLRTVSRVPVEMMPHIWSPMFIERQARKLEKDGQPFGFRPATPRFGWRAGIFEPNISVAKSYLIPMLVCEHAYRTARHAIDLMMVMNTVQMKQHPTFNSFAVHLDLTRDKKASYEPRLAFAECMAVHKLDVVVAHQWENPQNYLYYDALYGGYPLVHNSDYLKSAGMGFYYPGFEAIKGGEALLQAWGKEPGFWADYRKGARPYLDSLSPEDPRNVAAYAQRIAHLMEGRP